MNDQETQEEKDKVGQKTSDFQIITELGRGSYGTVYKVVSINNNQEYVMKKINIKHMKPKHQKEALKEAQILRKIKHQNIIKYYTSFMEKDVLYIIMEYADNGDLQQSIKEKKKKNQHFPEQEIWDMAWNLLASVDYLHKNNIIHRDIKTLNIFLTKDKKIKLGDLGVSKIVSSQMAQQATVVGTPLYLAPELVKQQPYDFKVDIWAIGCVLYHIAALEPPFQGDNLITLGFNIVHKNPKPLSGIYSGKLSNLINKFLEKNPNNRQSSKEFLEKFPNKQAFINQDKIEQEKQQKNQGKQMHYQDSKKENKSIQQNPNAQGLGRIDVFDQKNLNGLISVNERKQLQNEKQKELDKQQKDQQIFNKRQQILHNQQSKVKNDYNNINLKVKENNNQIFDVITKNKHSDQQIFSQNFLKQQQKSKESLENEYKQTKQQIQAINQEKLNEIQDQKLKYQQSQQKQQQQQQKQISNQDNIKKIQDLQQANKLYGSQQNQQNQKYTNMISKNTSNNQTENIKKQNFIADIQAIDQDKDKSREEKTQTQNKLEQQKPLKTEGTQQSPINKNFAQKTYQKIDSSKIEKEQQNKENIRKNIKNRTQVQASSTTQNFFKKEEDLKPQQVGQSDKELNSKKDIDQIGSNNALGQNGHKFKIRPYSAQIKTKSYMLNNQKEPRTRQQELEKIENLVQNFKKVNEEYLNTNLNSVSNKEKNNNMAKLNNNFQSFQQQGSKVDNHDYQLNNPNTNKQLQKQQQQSQTPSYQKYKNNQNNTPSLQVQPKTTSSTVESFENKFQQNQNNKKTSNNQQSQFQQQQYNKLPQRVNARPKSANVGGYGGFVSGGFKKQQGQSIKINPLFASPFTQNENSHKKIVSNYLKNTIGKMTLHQEINPYENQNNGAQALMKKVSTIEPINEVDELKIQANNYLNIKNKQSNNKGSPQSSMFLKDKNALTNQNFYSNNIKDNNKQHIRPQTANVNSNRKKITLRDLINN